jgi:hypothetical protein
VKPTDIRIEALTHDYEGHHYRTPGRKFTKKEG